MTSYRKSLGSWQRAHPWHFWTKSKVSKLLKWVSRNRTNTLAAMMQRNTQLDSYESHQNCAANLSCEFSGDSNAVRQHFRWRQVVRAIVSRLVKHGFSSRLGSARKEADTIWGRRDEGRDECWPRWGRLQLGIQGEASPLSSSPSSKWHSKLLVFNTDSRRGVVLWLLHQLSI